MRRPIHLISWGNCAELVQMQSILVVRMEISLRNPKFNLICESCKCDEMVEHLCFLYLFICPLEKMNWMKKRRHNSTFVFSILSLNRNTNVFPRATVCLLIFSLFHTYTHTPKTRSHWEHEFSMENFLLSKSNARLHNIERNWLDNKWQKAWIIQMHTC